MQTETERQRINGGDNSWAAPGKSMSRTKMVSAGVGGSHPEALANRPREMAPFSLGGLCPPG